MSDATPGRSTTSERLAAAVKLADECKQGLRQLGEFQEACALQFRMKERELIEQLSRLQTLVEEYLPLASEEQLAADAAADDNRAAPAAVPTDSATGIGDDDEP